MSLQIETELLGDVTNVTVVGDLNTHTAPDLQAAVKTILAQKNPSIVMDMAGVNYVSSYGLRVIVFTAKAMRSHKNRFVMHSVHDDVLSILKLGGFMSFVRVADTAQDAMEQVAQ